MSEGEGEKIEGVHSLTTSCIKDTYPHTIITFNPTVRLHVVQNIIYTVWDYISR